jgi:uncharacterized protein with HEPN domain
MQANADKRLRDAVLACEELATYTHGRTLSDYETDRGLRRKVERVLEILGEAIGQAVRIEPSLVEAIPDALVIVGMRNRIAHGYDDLKDEVIWDAATSDVPRLGTTLRDLLTGREGL